VVSKAEQKEAIWGIENARRYADEHRKYAKLIYRGALKDSQALNISGRYLEMAAGPGLLAITLAKQNPDITVTAVDLSPDMAAVANEYIIESKLADRIHYVVGDVHDEKLVQGLGKFNLVYSTY
jgi:tRNA1(Val) A37 N6-methylase TrmN6